MGNSHFTNISLHCLSYRSFLVHHTEGFSWQKSYKAFPTVMCLTKRRLMHICFLAFWNTQFSQEITLRSMHCSTQFPNTNLVLVFLILKFRYEARALVSLLAIKQKPTIFSCYELQQTQATYFPVLVNYRFSNLLNKNLHPKFSHILWTKI